MKYVLPATACIIAVALWVIVFLKSSPDNSGHDGAQSSRVQCAHWSVLRSSQLLGVTLGMDYLLKRLPYREQGHSLLQMSKVLKEIGFETEGRNETLQTLQNQTFPCIAHLTNPDHYVVVSAIDDKYVHIFDGDGHRVARERAVFAKQWSGNALFVRKPAIPKRLPVFLPKPKGNVPLAVFDSVICDLGTVPAVGEPVAFGYTIRNVGSADLVIKKIIPDCACIESKKPEAPIRPGEAGTIEFSYHVQPQRGTFSHTVLVESNDPQTPLVAVMASGWSGVDLRVEPRLIYLQDTVSGHEKTFRCFVKFTGDEQDLQVQLGDVSLDNANLVKHVLNPVTEEVVKEWFPEFPIKSNTYGQSYVLELTFLPIGDAGDVISGKIVLDTNIGGYEKFTLNVSGLITYPVRSFPQIVSLSNIEENGITLVSRTDEPFEVVSVLQGDGVLSWSVTDDSNESAVLLFFNNSAHQISADLPINVRVNFSKSDKFYELPIRVIP